VILAATALSQAQQWEEIQLPPSPDGLWDYWLEVYFLPSNPRFGWAVGANRHIIRTTDGGRTWQRSIARPRNTATDTLIFSPLSTILEGIMFADSLVGYCSGPGGIYRSDDGGATWRDISDSTMAGGVWGCYCTSRDTVYAVVDGCGGPQAFYRSTNGGQSWSSFLGSEPNSGLTDVVMFSSQGLGYASSSGRIWRTLNGGQSWTVFARTGAPNTVVENVWQEDLSISGRSFLVPLSGLSCGGGGAFGGARFSTDNGQTWREVQTGRVMYGTFLLDSLRGWAVGNEATALYTADGGRSWTNLNCGIPDSIDLDDLWFVNDTLGFVGGGQFGRRGALYRFVPPRSGFRLTVQQPNPVCVGDSVVLTAPDGWRTYSWSNGSTALNERSRRLVVRQSGAYSVRGCSERSDTVSIVFLPRPSATVTMGTVGRACEGDSVSLLVVSPLPRQRFLWSVRTSSSTDSLLVQGFDATTLRVGRGGMYTLTVENETGCRASTSITVTIFARPITTITALRPPRFCLGDSTILSAPNGFVRYAWSAVEENIVTRPNFAQTRVVTTRSSGRYSVQLTDSNGCIWTSNAIDVTALNLSKQVFISTVLPNGMLTFDTTTIREMQCKSLVLTNVDSLRSVTLAAAPIARNVEFSIPQAQFPLVIPPRSQRALQICFSPTSTALQRDTLSVSDSCGTVSVPLVGIGRPAVLGGITRCSPEIIVRVSNAAGGMPALQVSQPLPNPASTDFTLAVGYVVDHQANDSQSTISPATAHIWQSAPTCTLYNAMGKEVASGRFVAADKPTPPAGSQGVISSQAIGKTLVCEGEFVVNVRGLTQGAYFAVVRFGQHSITLPVRIEP
jgi:photosystem II stability/assembly factor-like uncharacterized protein